MKSLFATLTSLLVLLSGANIALAATPCDDLAPDQTTVCFCYDNPTDEGISVSAETADFCHDECMVQNANSYEFGTCDENGFSSSGELPISYDRSGSDPINCADLAVGGNRCTCTTSPDDPLPYVSDNIYDDAPSCESECVRRGYPGSTYFVKSANGCFAGSVPGAAPDLSVTQKSAIIPNLNVKIPGLDLSQAFKIDRIAGRASSNALGLYVQAAYRYLIGVSAIIAVVMLMVGGLEYVVSAGSEKRVSKAKERMRNAVVGLVLILLAYDLAFLISPDTVLFKPLSIQYLQAVEINNETPASFHEQFPTTTLSGPENLPLMDQTAYASVPYGPPICKTATSGNIKSSGCGVVAFSMAASGLSGRTLSPETTAALFYKEGFRPINSSGCGYNGTKYDAFLSSSLVKNYGLKSRLVPIGNKEELLSLIKAGKVIITSYNNGMYGHFVVINGMDESGNLIVNNPWGGTRELRTTDWWFRTIKSAVYIDRAADFIEP